MTPLGLLPAAPSRPEPPRGSGQRPRAAGAPKAHGTPNTSGVPNPPGAGSWISGRSGGPVWRGNARWVFLLLLALLAAWAVARGLDGPPWLPGRFVPAGGMVRAELAFAWPEYPGRIALTAAERQALVRALDRARPAAGGRTAAPPGPHFAYWQLAWVDGAGRHHRLLVAPDGRSYSPEQGHLDRSGPLWTALQPVTRRLAATFFGEPLPWPEVDRLWPRDAVAVLRDLETGHTLRVTRYGGYQHADAEPVTRQDTAVLRSVYGGSWSWRRRAVVLEVGGRRIAASINGMPHGDEVVAGNGFDGHFCVHTLEATTHVGDRVDPGHHLMVLKSGGRLVDHLRSAPPHAVATWLWVALANGDTATAAHMVTDPRDPGWEALARRLATLVQFVEVQRATTLAVQGPRARVRLRGTVYYAGDRPAASLDVSWPMTRQDGFWTVAAADVAALLPPPVPPAPEPGDGPDFPTAANPRGFTPAAPGDGGSSAGQTPTGPLTGVPAPPQEGSPMVGGRFHPSHTLDTFPPLAWVGCSPGPGGVGQ